MFYLKQIIKLKISLILLLFTKILFFTKKTSPIKKLLIVKIDNIGDYILFRNFLKEIKESKKYEDYEITLCGNIIFKEIAEFFDSDSVDKFIWIDVRKFQKNIFYALSILKEISRQGFDTAVHPVLSRSWGDVIAIASFSKNKIAPFGNTHNILPFQKYIFNKFYNFLLKDKEEKTFEFIWNKNFFEVFLSKNLDHVDLFLDTEKIKPILHIDISYVVVFPGASNDKKCWDIKNYCKIIEYILNNTNYSIVISGGTREIKDEKFIQNYFKDAYNDRLIYFVNKLSLVELVSLLKNSKLLISNETVAPHIAAAVGTKFICISNGEAIGRFHPYSTEVFSGGIYVYSPEIDKCFKDKICYENI